MSDASAEQPIAGPSRPIKPLRKPKAAHPSSTSTTTKRHKYPPALPPKTPSSHPTTRPNGYLPSIPNKVLQGQSTRRVDASRTEYGRDVIFVTRKVGLGALLGRCRKLVVDEGYTHLTLHAINAAIPHALLLLHALIDILPYPKGPKGMWYEIHTGTTECVDEVEALAGTEVDEGFEGIGGVEESEPERVTRLNSTMRIQLHMTPKPPAKATQPKRLGTVKKPNRKSKSKREASARRRKADGMGGMEDVMDVDEEEEMNGVWGDGMQVGEEEEEEEEEEQVEER